MRSRHIPTCGGPPPQDTDFGNLVAPVKGVDFGESTLFIQKQKANGTFEVVEDCAKDGVQLPL